MNKNLLLVPLVLFAVFVAVGPSMFKKQPAMMTHEDAQAVLNEFDVLMDELVAHLVERFEIHASEADLDEYLKLRGGVTLDDLVKHGSEAVEMNRLIVLAMEGIVHDGKTPIAAAQVFSPTYEPESFLFVLEDMTEQVFQATSRVHQENSTMPSKEYLIENYRTQGLDGADRMLLMKTLFPFIQLQTGFMAFEEQAEYYLITYAMKNETEWLATRTEHERKLLRDQLEWHEMMDEEPVVD